MLEPKSLVLYYLQRLRDEGHRFAIGAHRTRCSMDMKKPAGRDRRHPRVQEARPAARLGSARGVSRAAAQNLAKVESVSAALAQRIYDHFHKG